MKGRFLQWIRRVLEVMKAVTMSIVQDHGESASRRVVLAISKWALTATVGGKGAMSGRLLQLKHLPDLALLFRFGACSGPAHGRAAAAILPLTAL